MLQIIESMDQTLMQNLCRMPKLKFVDKYFTIEDQPLFQPEYRSKAATEEDSLHAGKGDDALSKVGIVPVNRQYQT